MWWLYCLISSFYIKPQPPSVRIRRAHIVLYRLSTSNHNAQAPSRSRRAIVLYRLSTSNHNLQFFHSLIQLLSYIVFLHQTTTDASLLFFVFSLSYIVFLHQTTTRMSHADTSAYCLISSFYIKPQPMPLSPVDIYIVLYRLSTSNHNSVQRDVKRHVIVLYRLSTSNHNWLSVIVKVSPIVLYRLSTSNHNCITLSKSRIAIVLYRLSTSNHNSAHALNLCVGIVLYRLSTSNHNFLLLLILFRVLSYIVFLHQTTTVFWTAKTTFHCLISSFYIKPQLHLRVGSHHVIVLYRLSTSNHNTVRLLVVPVNIVLYRLSTSNHNVIRLRNFTNSIVLYRLSTSNHNLLIYSPDLQSVLLYMK